MPPCAPRRLWFVDKAGNIPERAYAGNMLEIKQYKLLPINHEGVTPQARQALQQQYGYAETSFRTFGNPEQAEIGRAHV